VIVSSRNGATRRGSGRSMAGQSMVQAAPRAPDCAA
jgi:hypothetical protein